MKNWLLALSVILFLPLVAQDNNNKVGAFITFEEHVFDFGDVSQGDVVRHAFRFKNTGSDSLRLSNVLTTCGCTIPSWPKKAIGPGETSEIVAVFNSAGKSGFQNKVITVMSNASNSQTTFTIKANILPAQQSEIIKQ